MLPTAAPVALKVYDFLGNEVRTLIYGMQAAGDHSVRFDAGDLASGVYFYKLRVGTKFVETKRMMLVH